VCRVPAAKKSPATPVPLAQLLKPHSELCNIAITCGDVTEVFREFDRIVMVTPSYELVQPLLRAVEVSIKVCELTLSSCCD
jgi:hypothetical protein